MTVSMLSKPAATPVATRDFLGHPRGLAVLFATEAWERFSYFGNAALVVLYMAKYLFDPSRAEAVLGAPILRAVCGASWSRAFNATEACKLTRASNQCPTLINVMMAAASMK